MCGICGELRFDGMLADKATIEKMLIPLKSRGPDDSGIYNNGSLAFGHQRLAIIDLSNNSHQPMIDVELGLALVFNGTIYNYRELRTELQNKGYNFFSTGDSEVIIKAWHAWGTDCVIHFHGMFAFAIWDIKLKLLFLARDRLGIKPLYWSEHNGYFRFASNTQALLATGEVNTEIDPIGLHYLFTLHAVVPAPLTIFKGIRKLTPGHWLQIDAKGIKIEKNYWNLNTIQINLNLTEAEWLEKISIELINAIKIRNEIADVPVGVLLSGGLDSSLLIALLAKIGIQDLRTFSIGFEDTPEEIGSEFQYSDLVVARYKTNHQKILIKNSQILQRLPEAINAMAEPMFGQDTIAFYLLAEQVKREIKVVQSGQGADEVFGGYFWYPRIQAEQTGTWIERFRKHYFDRDHQEYLFLINDQYCALDYTSELVAQQLAAQNVNKLLDAVLRFDVTTLIVDDPVKRVDNMTMAWGLEARVPFLDHQLVELMASCPSELKIRAGGKSFLKKLARGILPDAVIDRPKGYFPLPALKYIRGDFFDLVRDVINSQACRQRGIYRKSAIDQLLADPNKYYTRIQGNTLWHLTVLELWLQHLN